MQNPSQIISALTDIAGVKSVVPAGNDMAAYVEEPRQRFHTPAAAVVLPESVEVLQAICRWANENGVALIPQGGGTGLVGGQVPLSGNEVIVSLKKLNKVIEVDAAAGNMTVEAGVTLHDAREAADQAGALFPLWIGSGGSAQIGGILSTNAGGVQVLAYGNARELCLGVEAVLADGRLYRGLNALRKDNTGYDLKDLLIGAEGTLGFVTAATLKLYPRPEDYEIALLAVDDPQMALALYDLVRERAGKTINAFELLPRIGIDFQLKQGTLSRDPAAGISPWYVLLELSRFPGEEPGLLESVLEAAFEKGLVGDASVIASSEAERQNLWQMREQYSECQIREGASIKHDVSVPVSKVPELLARGSADAEKAVPGIRPVPFGHLGDGNIHFNFSQPEGMERDAFMALEEKVHDAVYGVVLDLGGSVSAEHGIGQLKVAELQRVKDPVALEMMRAIKTALDPKGILNPGKVLPLPPAGD